MKFILLVCFLLPHILYSQITGKVVGITDGDTFKLLTDEYQQVKIRLHGIDCPEKGQEFGKEAKVFLSQLIFGKKVVIQEKGKDRYGRTLGIVFVNTININEQMLLQGFAWHFKKYDKNPIWAKLELSARGKKKGIWSQNNPIAPWEWRKHK